MRQDRLLLAFGAVAGVAALTKFQVLLLCAVLLVAVAAVGPRDLLRRPLLWVGMAIAVLLTAPTMVWQYANGWPQLRMASVVVGEAEALYGGRPGIAVQLIAYAGVAGVMLVLYGLWRVFRDPALRDYRFLGVTFVVLYVFFVATAGRPYYLAGLYAPLAAVGALALQRRRESGADPHPVAVLADHRDERRPWPLAHWCFRWRSSATRSVSGSPSAPPMPITHCPTRNANGPW